LRFEDVNASPDRSKSVLFKNKLCLLEMQMGNQFVCGQLIFEKPTIYGLFMVIKKKEGG
jgi:hypothetical protein